MDIRISPVDGVTELLPADYRTIIRSVAFQLLANKEHEALMALWSTLSDEASGHFEHKSHATSEHMRTYFASKRQDTLELLYEVEDAAKMCPDFPRGI